MTRDRYVKMLPHVVVTTSHDKQKWTSQWNFIFRVKSLSLSLLLSLGVNGPLHRWRFNHLYFQIGMNQVEKPASGYAAPYRGQGTKVTDCVLPTRVQALPKPSHIIQAPWTIEVRLCATHKGSSLAQTLPHHTGTLDQGGKIVCYPQGFKLYPNLPTSYRHPGPWK